MNWEYIALVSIFDLSHPNFFHVKIIIEIIVIVLVCYTPEYHNLGITEAHANNCNQKDKALTQELIFYLALADDYHENYVQDPVDNGCDLTD